MYATNIKKPDKVFLFGHTIIIFSAYFNRAISGGKKDQVLTNKTRPTHRRTDANLYPLKRQLTKTSEPLFDLEGGAQGQI